MILIENIIFKSSSLFSNKLKENHENLRRKIVLAYSGGLDTSVLIKWLQQKYDAEVITVTLDVGQKEDLEVIEKKALKLGVLKHYSIDAREEFVKNYVFPAIKANALYEGKYPVSTALSRPLIASKLVEVAEKEGADAVAHGCTGKGNDQVRFELTYYALNPKIKVISPWKDPEFLSEFKGRSNLINYAKKEEIPIKVTKKDPIAKMRTLCI